MTVSEEKYTYNIQLGSHDSRLKKGSTQEVIDFCYAPRFAAPMPTFKFMIQYNLAHIVEMNRIRVISDLNARDILKALVWIKDKGLEYFKLDPKLESLMPNMEAILISKLGPEVGGQVLTGRSRGEVETVSGILCMREKLLDLLEGVQDLRGVTIDMAGKHTHTVMPGYTHLQHAQPTTLGHYMCCVAEALEQDYDRLVDAYRKVNLSPVEAGTSWGNSYPIDRKRVAVSLGFEGMLENTRYSYASIADKAMEVTGALTILDVNLNRLTEDLNFWCTPEYMTADVADEYAGTSFIMPQKKNVTALQRYSSLLNNTFTTFNRLAIQTARASFGLGANLAVNLMESGPEAILALNENIRALKMLRGLVTTIKFNKEVLRDRAGIHFTQGTELADALFREKGIPFRTAHRIVGTLVRKALSEGKKATEIDEKMLNDSAIEIIGEPISPPYEKLWKVLDPMEVVKSHNGIGGPAPEAVEVAIKNRRNSLYEDIEDLKEKRQKLISLQQDLESQVNSIINGK